MAGTAAANLLQEPRQFRMQFPDYSSGVHVVCCQPEIVKVKTRPDIASYQGVFA